MDCPEASGHLTGPGGAGKTRLAGEVGRRVAGRFADGGWLAELAAVRDPAQVASSHLDRIRDKTGCRRRADLTRLALSAALV